MKYQVDLSRKKIVYEESVPAGHVAALRKIFERQGYGFEQVVNIQTVDELMQTLQGEMQREFILHGGSGRMTGMPHVTYSNIGMPVHLGSASSHDYGGIYAFGKHFPDMAALEDFQKTRYTESASTVNTKMRSMTLEDAFDEAHDLQKEMHTPEEVRTLRQKLTALVTKGKSKQ